MTNPMPTEASPDLPTDPSAALSASWFGAGLPPATVAQLAALAVVHDLAPGDVIIHEGEVAETLGVVLSGRVALRMLVPERGMVTILTVEPGDIVEWSAVVPPFRGTADAIAIEPVQLLELPGERLRALLRTDPALSASVYPRILQAVGRRLGATRLQLLDLFAREEWGHHGDRSW
jgi:CRP/FNR family transcriptional regulator, cyclic AMP receptor protein